MNITQNTPTAGLGEVYEIGNGYMGALVYGGIQKDVIELSENTFCSGNKSESDNRTGANTAFDKMREEAVRVGFKGVHKASEEFYSRQGSCGRNLPVGQIVVEHRKRDENKNSSFYERHINIEEGTVETQYKVGDSQVHTLAFASHSRKMICYEVTSEGEKMDLAISFQPFREKDEAVYQLGGIFFVCEAREEMCSEGYSGTLLCGKAVLYTDGFPQAQEEKIVVRNAHRMALYITSITDSREEPLEKNAQILALQMKMNREFIKVEDLKFEQILDEHKKTMGNCKCEKICME